MKRHKQLSLLPLFMVLILTASSCVHEWPAINNNVSVRLKIHHDLPWTEYNHVLGTRTDDIWKADYTLHAYRKGDYSKPAYIFNFTRSDLSLDDFETTLTLPEGEWNIYAWQDLQNPDGRCYYIADDFSAVSYRKPYVGDTDMRDAFEGSTEVTVPSSIEENITVSAEINMERPFAKYVFIATDFRKFYSESVLRGESPSPQKWEHLTADQKAEALNMFSVNVRYPLYMPAVYNLFQQKITDSLTGMGYEATIRPLNADEAVICMDYVFMNHHNSGAQVQLQLKSPSGSVSTLTSTITVPLRRGQITYVRGEFLTASIGDGINIDFSFSGDINIKL